MSELVTVRNADGVTTIAMDDGKRNALSLRMLDALDAAFDRAEADGGVVVLTGREGVFSAGFDLTVLKAGGPDAAAMLGRGFALAERLLAFPRPVVIAATGHAIAMGVFLLLSGDYRIGLAGPFKITANEVALGLTMPHAAVEICRQRLTPAHFSRAVILADLYTPESALEAGFLDRVVAPDEFVQTVQTTAQQLSKLNMAAHAATKLRVRGAALQAMRTAFEADKVDFQGFV